MKAWETLKSEVIHRNPWWHLKVDDFVLPNGKPDGKYYYVERERGSVGIIAEEGDGEIYLVEQTRYIKNKQKNIEIIAGVVGENEDFLGVAKQELKDEANLEADIWISLGTIHPDNSILNVPIELYLARGLSNSRGQVDETEDIAVHKYGINEIEEMILKGKIVNGYTMAAIYKYLIYKKKQK